MVLSSRFLQAVRNCQLAVVSRSCFGGLSRGHSARGLVYCGALSSGALLSRGPVFLWGPVYSAGAQYLNLATGSANVLLMLVCPEVEYRLIVGSRAAYVAAGFMPAKMFERSACVDCCFFDFCPAEF